MRRNFAALGLASTQSAREQALAGCRRAIRFAGSAIRAVHARDLSRWEALFDQSAQALREAQSAFAKAEARELARKAGFEVVAGAPEQLAARVAAEIPAVRELVARRVPLYRFVAPRSGLHFYSTHPHAEFAK